jgi:predicted SAM-dependent methyltransferase
MTGFAGRWLDRWASLAIAYLNKRYSQVETGGKYPVDWSSFPTGRKLLHVGCGNARKEQTVKGFQSDEWIEVRLDADPDVSPDIVGTMVSLPMIPDGVVDAIFSSHNIEHLYWPQVGQALAEFFRVLESQGFLILTCPDLQSVARLIADDKLLDTAYQSPAGPVTPFDMLYGMRSMLTDPNYFMAHRSGFTLSSLMAAVQAAGFPSCLAVRRESAYDLWIFASKQVLSEAELRIYSRDFLP